MHIFSSFMMCKFTNIVNKYYAVLQLYQYDSNIKWANCKPIQKAHCKVGVISLIGKGLIWLQVYIRTKQEPHLIID